MGRTQFNLQLPHDNRKTAKRALVKLTSSDAEVPISRVKTCNSSLSETAFKSKNLKASMNLAASRSKKLKSSSTVNSAENRVESSKSECSVLPSVVKLKKQRIIRMPSQDDLWKSIRSNYWFIMDNNLIKECQKTRKELSLCSSRSSPTCGITQQPISFPEFIERFNFLHDRLHILLTSIEDYKKDGVFNDFHVEIDLLRGEYFFLSGQASILQRLDPQLKDDVSRRCTILKNKWEILEGALWPMKKRERDERTKSLKEEIRNTRRWLRGIEERLRRLKITQKSSPEDVRNIYNKEKVLQREIEERGREINSLVRRCQSPEDGATTAPQRLCRFAQHLERSWHHIWIRSLETQCLTEQHLLKQAAVTSQSSPKEASDLDSDEGPLRKQRRLTLDHWTAVAATMDRLRKEHGKTSPLQTRDVGVLCSSERVPVNDKCIMVGTTGIAALKAEYGDDFTNFEIIQDVGYSSESSTHLSGDDTTGLDHPHHLWTTSNFRIYNYAGKDHQIATSPINLREELESVARLRDFHHSLGSSLESSSLDDSGLGTGEALTTGESGDVQLIGQFRVDDEEDEYGQEELDYLETVLDECVDFGANAVSDPEELHFNLSGLDSDDPSDNFHKRSSFTKSAQVFYKMISVDSDNGDADNNTSNEHNNNHSINDNNNNLSTNNRQGDNTATTDISTLENKDVDLCNNFNGTTKCNSSSDSDPETFKPVHFSSSSITTPKEVINSRTSHRMYCSTPKLDNYHGRSACRSSLKRKRGYSDSLDSAKMSGRIRSWLNRCSDFSVRRPSSRTSEKLQTSDDLSSCDASCEGTTSPSSSSSSSSADEGGNLYSSRSSQNDDLDVFRFRSRVDSSVQGSVETVLQSLLLEDTDFPFILLPPPPSSTASSFGSIKNCGSSTICGGSSRKLKKRDRRLKASSDGDVEKLRSSKVSSRYPTPHMLQKHNPSKATTIGGSERLLHSSLPTILCHSSDSSTDDNCVSSTLPSHSDTKTATGCVNRSSSSEIGRRRRRRSRKKSSSSNRSSTSVLQGGADGSRQRSRTLTSSTSRCGSRRRHRSQKSDFFYPDVVSSDEGNTPLKVEIPPVEENTGFDELCRASSALLSPTESDIVLTHLEEQSTVSDQVWDGYQEMPYLSEGYSEATVDEDAVRKLTEFGDDYGSAIGQPARLLEPPDSNTTKVECPKSPKKCLKSIPVATRLSNLSDESDSDSEDLYYVIEEAAKALNFARDILQRRKKGEPLTPANYAELLATCGTHLRCLQTICKHIDGQEHKFSSSHLKQLHYLIEQWQELQRSTEMFEKSEDPARQKYLKAQENIDALYNRMSQLASCSYLDVVSFASWEDVDKNMSRLQMVLTSLQESKEQLLSVNLQVHRFTTEYGDDDNYKDCSLKDDITELYRQWEDTYEQNGAQLTELEALKTDWEVYNDKLRELRLRVKSAELGENEDICDNDTAAVISTERDTINSLRKDLRELERCATLLESRLKGGDAWKAIEDELRDLRRKILVHREDSILQRTVSPSANHRSPSSRVEEDADDHFEDAIQQLCAEDSDPHSPALQKKKDVGTSMTPKRTRGRFWRIVRVAVPVQFAIVLLYCLACYLEPSCCNALNNFNFSFTPQLRYLGGRPPV